MGSRASYVLLEGGQTSYWYAHWGGQTVPERLLAGPERTAAYLRTLIPTSGLLDTVWAEGGILLDLDCRCLRFWGGEDVLYSPQLRRALLPALRRLWPGWDIAWATFGIANFARYLHLDVSTVLAGEIDHLLAPCALEELRHEPERDPDFSVITVQWDGERVADLLIDVPVGRALGLGPALLEALRGRASEVPPREDATWLDGGAFLDASARSMSVWDNSRLDPRFLAELAERWLGWSVEGHVEGLARQLEDSGRDTRPFRQPDAEVRRHLVRTLLPKPGPDPAGLVEHLRAARPERRVTVANPYVFTREEPVLTPEEQRKILRELFPDVIGDVAELA